MALIYIDKVTTNQAAFAAKVITICSQLSIDPNWLMAVMYIESGLNPASVNSSTGAVGLIQFLPSTAIELGTTAEALRSMSNVDQLDYVYSYLKPYRSKIQSFTDCYFAVFFPAAIGHYSDWILQAYGMSAGYVAGKNGGYDPNNDNEITFREVEGKILLMVDPQYRAALTASKVPVVVDWTPVRILEIALALILMGAGGILIFQIFKK